MIKLQVIGHLGKNAIKGQVNGKSVLNFNVAHSERYKNLNGEDTERTTWTECSLWEREHLAPYLLQGVQVFVEGTCHLETYTNRNGQPATSLRLRVTNLQLLSKRGGGGAAAPAANATEVVDAVAEPAEELPF